MREDNHRQKCKEKRSVYSGQCDRAVTFVTVAAVRAGSPPLFLATGRHAVPNSCQFAHVFNAELGVFRAFIQSSSTSIAAWRDGAHAVAVLSALPASYGWSGHGKRHDDQRCCKSARHIGGALEPSAKHSSTVLVNHELITEFDIINSTYIF